MPRIDDSLDALGGNKYSSVMDLSSGYWQVGVHPDDQLPLMACIILRSCHMECAIREFDGINSSGIALDHLSALC